ncbi:YesL family protein [Actinomyces sp.]|uniref:YesL family protein n=1 Tax=Actinomyces sp. TaxID=29317 RepID=UPI0026DC6A35|nr:YesL family protein [Actinomyces sp.]MDO4901349.1 YesL family protein [Actinomyces sp.]
MSSFLRPDSAFYRAWSAAADLVVINLLTLLWCLPVVTAGSALTACARVVMEMAREEDTYTVRTWWRSFSTNFRQSLAWWLPTLAAGVLAAWMNLALSQLDGASALTGLVNAGVLLGVGVLVWLVPLVAFFDNTVRVHLANAVRLTIGRLGRTALCAALVVVPAAVVLALPGTRGAAGWFTLLLGVAFTGYLMALIQRPVIDVLREGARTGENGPCGEVS